MKNILFITLLILFLTGVLNLFILGDYTHRFYQVTGIHEDEQIIETILKARWDIIHLTNSLQV